VTTFTENNVHVKLIGDTGLTYDIDVCNDVGYNSLMTDTFNQGMVFAMSFYGGDSSGSSWLDGSTGCSGDCDTNGTITFSNFEIDNYQGNEVFLQ